MKNWIIYLLLFWGAIKLPAQTDTFPRTFKKIDIFPAISYTPETSLTLGAIGYYYFDLARENSSTNLSNVNFLAAYTLAKQIAIELRWDIFTDNNLWRTRGETFYNRYPDRNYGLGNEAALLIVDVDGDQYDTLNYVQFDSDRIKFSPIIQRRLGKNWYLGLQGDLEYLFRMRPTSDLYYPLNDASTDLLDFPVEGLRVGLGVNMLFDSRDNIFNSYSGTYIEFSNYFYNKTFGSDFDFCSFLVDGRTFINVKKNHTLALRGVANLRFSDDAIPLRALSRVGGHKFIRGYFKGTYQDNHLLAFEMEYRWPLWNEHLNAPGWQIWKRMGLVAFIGGAEVFHELDDFQINQFNLAAGGGVRFLLNKATRLNIRIDYGVGFAKNSDGLGKRQSGLYFYLAEAF